MAPTKEEELKLRDCKGDVSKLSPAERFLKAVLDIPFSFKRVGAMLYQANFETEVTCLGKSYETLETIKSYREGAAVCQGDALCKKKSVELLEKLELPNGLFPLEDVEEFGYNSEAGFVWLVQMKKNDHNFKKIKRAVSYATEVTAFVEPHKMKKMTGVKTKELFLLLSVVEMYIDDPSSEKVTFKTGTGLSDSFPASVFKLEN